MKEIFARNVLYWGEDVQEFLLKKHVFVFGLGGVGGYCVEMLARAGIGELTIVDFDTVSLSNINRQIVALNSTVGKDKTELFEARLKDINPDIKVNAIKDFYTEDLNDFILEQKPDYIADAIDTLRSKVSLIEWAHKNNLPIISSFGAGNRIDPEFLYVSDISKIKDKNTPFVSNILYQLEKKGITEGIKVVTSKEKPQSKEKVKVVENVQTQSGKEIEYTKITPSSTPFVASASGIIMASYIVQKLIKNNYVL